MCLGPNRLSAFKSGNALGFLWIALIHFEKKYYIWKVIFKDGQENFFSVSKYAKLNNFFCCFLPTNFQLKILIFERQLLALFQKLY